MFVGNEVVVCVVLMVISGDQFMILLLLFEGLLFVVDCVMLLVIDELFEFCQVCVQQVSVDVGVQVVCCVCIFDFIFSLIGGQVCSGLCIDQVIGVSVFIFLFVFNIGCVEVDVVWVEVDVVVVGVCLCQFVLCVGLQEV